MKDIFKRFSCIWLCLVILAGAYLGYLRFQPLKAEKVDESPMLLSEAGDSASFKLMLSDLKQLSSEVHSVDTEGIYKVHNFIKDRLNTLGYKYTEEPYALTIDEILRLREKWMDYRSRENLDDEQSIRDYSGIGDKPTLNINNISVFIDSPNSDDIIVFMAHTDSVKEGPGTFDDTIAVACMLESLRLLKDTTPKRDMLFLFTDGEEQGLLGAFKYVEDNKDILKNIKMIINLEARGNHGAMLMFETSENNLQMVKTLNDALNRPVSTSIATGVYRTMQNDTDLTVFFMENCPGMNFACIDNPKVYHTAQDNYDTFSRDTAAQYLNDITDMALYFANADSLNFESNQDAVFFPLFGKKLIILPQNIANIISWAIGILSFVFMLYCIINKKASLIKILISFALSLLCMVITYFISLGLINLVHNIGNFKYEIGKSLIDSDWITPLGLIMFIVFSILNFIFIGKFANKKITDLEKALGVIMLPSLLCIVLPFVFPSASYLFTIITFFTLLVIVVSRFNKPIGFIFYLIAAFMIMLVIAPITYLVYTALTIYNLHLALVFFLISILSLGALKGVLK